MAEDHGVRPYNFIYSQLVEDEDDIVGLIAYALYKRQKIEYIRSIQSRHQRDIELKELAIFHEISNSDTQIKNYRDQSVSILNAFLNEALRERVSKISEEYQTKFDQELRNVRPQFWSGIFQSLIGSVLFVMFVGLIIFFTWSMQQGPKQVIERIFNVQILNQEQSKSPASPK